MTPPELQVAGRGQHRFRGHDWDNTDELGKLAGSIVVCRDEFRNDLDASRGRGYILSLLLIDTQTDTQNQKEKLIQVVKEE